MKTVETYQSKLAEAVNVTLEQDEKEFLLWIKMGEKIISYDFVDTEQRGRKMVDLLKNMEKKGYSVLETLNQIEAEVNTLEGKRQLDKGKDC